MNACGECYSLKQESLEIARVLHSLVVTFEFARVLHMCFD